MPFPVTYLGLLSQLLGLEISQYSHGIKFHQYKYASDMISKFTERDCLLEGCNEPCISMTDLGLLSQFLGLKIAQSQHGIKVHQSKYALDLLNNFNMKYCKPSKTQFLSGVKLEEHVLPLW